MQAQNVDPGPQGDDRRRALAADDREREARLVEERKNAGFTQVYGPGWKRLQLLVKENPPAARLYMWIAEHSEGPGVVVASQDLIAEQLNIHRTTVWRLSKALEKAEALVRIKVHGSVWAYALNPHEVWKGWNTTKEHAVFVTKTLVKKGDVANKLVDRRLRTMMGEPELPFDASTTAEPA